MYDLSSCMIDFTQCPKGVKLVDNFPELNAFKEFTQASDENYIKIAICTADMESPFTKMKDRESMLVALFGFLGIPLSSKEDKVFYSDVLQYKHTEVLDCFARYLQIYHDIDWTEYQSTKQTHDVLTMEANRPKEDKEGIDAFVKRRVNIQNHLKDIGQDLKKIEARIFPDSRSAREVALNETKKIKTYAERYSEENTYL